MENMDISSWIVWLSSMIGAITAIAGAILGFSKKARAALQNMIRKNADTDDTRQDIDALKTAVEDMIALQKSTVENQQLALQAILRHEITDLYYKHLENKRLAAYEKEDLLKLAKAYEKNGGNSYVQEIVKEMKQWDLLV